MGEDLKVGTHLFFAAEVPWKTYENGAPYVSWPVGPYTPEEAAAIERAKAVLAEMWPNGTVHELVLAAYLATPLDVAHMKLQRRVFRAWEQRKYAAECEAMAALENTLDVDERTLDEVLEELGVDPADV